MYLSGQTILNSVPTTVNSLMFVRDLFGEIRDSLKSQK